MYSLYLSICKQAVELSRNVKASMGLYICKFSTKCRCDNSNMGFFNPNQLEAVIAITQTKITFGTLTQTYSPEKTNSNVWSPGTRHLSKQEWEDHHGRGLCTHYNKSASKAAYVVSFYPQSLMVYPLLMPNALTLSIGLSTFSKSTLKIIDFFSLA